MVRPNQLLHTQREPVAARAAATVLLLRDGEGGIEVLMTRRAATASFAPGAYVFPGGGIDAADAQAHAQAGRRVTQSDLHLTQAIAAIRESFEELGVLLARHADGAPADASDIARLDRQAPFVPQCRRLGLTLAADQVFVLAHWITDRDLPRRFDVPFLVARMPEDQTPVADETEQFEPVWVRPGDALAQHAAGQFFIIFPTIRTLAHLQAYPTVDAVLQACAATEEPLWTSCPRAGLLAGREARYTETDPPYGELALVCPDGQILHPLDWQSEQPVALLKNVMRLTAPNPGVMTGPGTNSYLVGDPHSGYIAIDPGPDEPEHLERLWRAAGGDIRLIVCTHSHPDHSPGARPLQILCAHNKHRSPHPSPLPEGEGVNTPARVSGSPHPGPLPQGEGAIDSRRLSPPLPPGEGWGEGMPPILGFPKGGSLPLPAGEGWGEGMPPILGLPSAPTARANSQFRPDRALHNQELLTLSGQGLQHTLKVIHTPGHAANHLCLVLLEDGLLFSGDHILNGSTTVVDPPDGDMTAYLESLDRLSAACEQHDIEFILPAHGHVLGQAKEAIARLKAHRLQREAKIVAVMQAHPDGTLDDWVARAYDDVPPRIWPLAKRSLLAHVQRIEQEAGAGHD